MEDLPDDRWSRLIAEHRERQREIEAAEVIRPAGDDRHKQWDVEHWGPWKRWLVSLGLVVGGPALLGVLTYWRALSWEAGNPAGLGVGVGLFWFALVGGGMLLQAWSTVRRPWLVRINSSIERVLGMAPPKGPHENHSRASDEPE